MNNNIELKVNERIDDLERNGYKIIQDEKRFCYGIDAVLLSHFAKVRKNEKVVDLGTGTGIIPILMHAINEPAVYSALEIQEDSYDMALRSVMLNNLQEDITIINGDIKEASKLLGTSLYNVVTSNPPYMIDDHGLKNEDNALTIARHEVLCSLEDVVREASRLLKVKGRFYMVHRPYRLPEIMEVMRKYHLEPKRMRLVHPYIDKEPNIVLIEALKGGRPRLTIESPLIVYKDVNEYSDEIIRIYNE